MSRLNQSSRRSVRSAFTIIELLVVLSLILLLIALVLPTFAEVRSRARYVRWAAYSKSLQGDQRALLYYTMEQQRDGGVLWNRVAGDPARVGQKDAAFPDYFNAKLMESPTAKHTTPDKMWVKGRWRSKGALEFNGVNEWAAAPFNKDLLLSNMRFTMFASVRVNALDDHDGLICLGTNATESAPWLFRLRSSGGRPMFNMYTNVNTAGTSAYYSTSPFELDEWALGAITFDGTNVRTYLNGKETSVTNAASLTFGPTTDGLSIGCDFPSGDEYFEGIMDELGVFRGIMKADEIRNMHQVGFRRTRD